MSDLLIHGGTVYDPVHRIDGEVKDIWIRDGKVITPPLDDSAPPSRRIDATGCIVMPGGVDMHCHVAGPKVNLARKMFPDALRRGTPFPSTSALRSGAGGIVPSSFSIGYMYAGLGYTTVCDAGVPPLFARHAHQEFADVPMVDKGFLALAGNHRYVLGCIVEGNREKLDIFCRWMIHSAKAYGLKIANPGGVESWKTDRTDATTIDRAVTAFGVTPREIVRELAQAADRLSLPHPVHIHCNQLGMPGNVATTLETMRAVEGSRAHFAHVQFHSYSGGERDTLSFGSAVPMLAEYVNSHSNISVDVGHVAFGPAVALTADTAVAHYLHKATGRRWACSDIEVETGCGVVPIEYRDESLVNGIQWAAGLEWYLLVEDPWRIAMSTDFPNGGSFTSYPKFIALLMNRDLREECLKQLHPAVRKRSVLADLKREYTPSEIVILTRAAPARLLGLTHKGHLGVGADGDVTIYSRNEDVEQMFALPRYVIKAGTVIVEDCEIRAAPIGSTYTADAGDASRPKEIETWFEQNYSVHIDNFAVEKTPEQVSVFG